MTNEIPELAKLKSEFLITTTKLEDIVKIIGNETISETIIKLKNRIHDPYMFVIVGEVKAGKSSLINALLESKEEICKVAPSPMTDTIQQIVYGPEFKVENINPYLKRIFQPNEVLKKIAIVDTPGTNTIIDHHQEITEKFVPISDLIVFVFEAKNPYRQSSWEFFDYINKDWHKKIIFVLQQKDLVDPEALIVNIKGVHENATKKGIPNPAVFAVSAKLELENKKDQSGFLPLREYIDTNITNKKTPYLKLENNCKTLATLNERIKEGVVIRQQQYDSDVIFREKINQTLNRQEDRTNKQIKTLTDSLLTSYDHITSRKELELSQGLGFVSLVRRSFSSMVGGSQNAKQWLDKMSKELELEFNKQLKNKLTDGVLEISESIQDMGKLVGHQIKESQTILKNDHELFADIADKRANVLKDLQHSFSGFLNNTENFYDESILAESGKITPNLMKGSGIAAVGVILTVVTNGAIFDITGGIITTIGLVFAGVTIGFKKRKILTGFNEAVSKGRIEIEKEIKEKLLSYTSKIKERILYNFQKFDDMLLEEKTILEGFESNQNQIITSLNSMNQEINVQLNQ